MTPVSYRSTPPDHRYDTAILRTGETVPGRLTTGTGDTPGRLGRLGTASPVLSALLH